MKLSSSLAVSVISLPALLSHASPIDRLVRRQTASYSVVAVDGGSSGAPAATTVTAPASTLPPTTRIEVTTLFSTIVLTEAPTPTTIVLTITSTAETTFMETMASTIPNSGPAANTTSSSPVRFSTITVSPSYTIPNTYLSPVTVTVTPSSAPYDDGMWHTTYYHPAAASSTPEAASPTTESSAASSTVAAANLVVSTYNTTSYNYTTAPVTNFTAPLNWTAPVNYTNARLRLMR